MNRKIAILILLCAVTLQLSAQNTGDLSRQMEVTRAYEPTVRAASKLNIKPNMVDTVALRPEISYKVTPNPIAQEFGVAPINVALVNLDMYKKLFPLYVKAGLGYPFQSLLDLYYTPIQKSNGVLGLYVNHYGSWSKITNQMDIKAPASQTFNKGGVLGEHRFGRYSVSGEIGYDYDMVSRYGYYSDQGSLLPLMQPSAEDLRQNFSTVRGRVNFGNSFEDLSYFNFRLGVDAAYFSDKFDMAQTDFMGYLDIGKLFNDRHEITLHTQYEGAKGSKALDAYEDNLVTIAPLYRLKTGKFNLGIGVDYTLNMADGESKSHLYPRLDLKLDITNGYFVPYLEINGRLIANSYRSLVARNPYVIEGLVMPNTSEYNGRVGISGSISSAFSYKLYGGVSRYLSMSMFSNLYSMNYEGNVFAGISDNATMWTLGGDIEGRISGAFSLAGSVQYRAYDMDNLEKPIGLPSITARLGVKYSYQDKLTLTLNGDLIGKRYFNDVQLFSMQWESLDPVNAQVDLSFGAEYRLSKKLGIFLNANNLLNSKLYNYGRYPSLGINAMAGVTLQF